MDYGVEKHEQYNHAADDASGPQHRFRGLSRLSRRLHEIPSGLSTES
jgi:hypothetical protein